jgi:hypothetical protein
MRDWDDHRLLADRLAKAKCKWVLSSYDVPEVHALYDHENYFIVPVKSASGMRVKKTKTQRVINREVLITNFPTAADLQTEAEAYQPRLELGDLEIE